MSTYKQVKNWFLELIFPPRCAACKKYLDSSAPAKSFCRACLSSLEPGNKFVCVFCETKSTDGLTCPFCEKRYHLDQLLNVFEYKGAVRRAVKEMKYRHIKNIALDLSGLMLSFAGGQIKKGRLNFAGDELVVPVPLKRLRLNRRGFNQAEVLAGAVAREFGLKLAPNILLRSGLMKKPQADIKERKQRIENAAGIYKCTQPAAVKRKTIWLTDDVSTTGATLDDCARALKEAGAKKVVGLVLAKGKLRRKPKHKI